MNLFLYLLLTIYLTNSIFPQEERMEKNGSNISQENILLDLGNSLYKEKRFKDALNIFLDFTDLYPNSTRKSIALEKTGMIYEEEQEYYLAAITYHRLYEKLGDTNKGLDHYFREARLWNIMGETEKAAAIYRSIIKVDPASDIAYKAQKQIDILNLFQ